MIFITAEVLIAKKNLERYAKTGAIDAHYLASLSDDALPYTIHLLDDPSVETRNVFSTSLFYHYDGWDDPTEKMGEHSWQSVRLNRGRAEQLLLPRKSLVKANMLKVGGTESFSAE